MKNLIVNTDGGARGNPGPAGIGVVIKNQEGEVLGRHKKYIGFATNNVAEYQALILALQEASRISSEVSLTILMDSELVVKQMEGLYKIKDPGLKALAAEALRLLKNYKNIVFKHIPREQNQEADRLVNEVLDAETT